MYLLRIKYLQLIKCNKCMPLIGRMLKGVVERKSLTEGEKAGCRNVGAPKNTVLYHNMQLAY